MQYDCLKVIATTLRHFLKQTLQPPWHISILIWHLVPQLSPSECGWVHLPDQSAQGWLCFFYTLFAWRHQTLINLHPGSANWLVSLVHIETPLLESFQCPSWRLLGSSLPWAPAPCLPDWVLTQSYSDWTWHGDRKQGRRAIEIKEQRWESEVGRDRDTGRWVW